MQNKQAPKQYKVKYFVEKIGWLEDVPYIAIHEKEVIEMVENNIENNKWIKVYGENEEIIGFKNSDIKVFQIKDEESSNIKIHK